MKPHPILVAAVLLAACGRQTVSGRDGPQAPSPPPPALPPVEPLPPGSPGALPDDRTPLAEGTVPQTSAQGAANVVQIYVALIEQGQYGPARALWWGGGEAAQADVTAFAARFSGFDSFHALVGAPGPMEGAAGSSYVEVPLQVYGRRKDGREVQALGSVTLRRVNDVPGSTAEQRLWRITAIAGAPAGQPEKGAR